MNSHLRLYGPADTELLIPETESQSSVSRLPAEPRGPSYPGISGAIFAILRGPSKQEMV